MLRAASRYNLPIRWLPERLAEQNFGIQEPPSKASPWVRVLLGHLQSLRQRLASQEALTPADVTEVGRHPTVQDQPWLLLLRTALAIRVRFSAYVPGPWGHLQSLIASGWPARKRSHLRTSPRWVAGCCVRPVRAVCSCALLLP